jgi:hypothetical protein
MDQWPARAWLPWRARLRLPPAHKIRAVSAGSGSMRRPGWTLRRAAPAPGTKRWTFDSAIRRERGEGGWGEVEGGREGGRVGGRGTETGAERGTEAGTERREGGSEGQEWKG